MLYVAFAMIMVGVLCFLYVSLSPGTAKQSSPRKRFVGEKNPQANGYSANYRYQPSSATSPQLDERIRRDREIAEKMPVWPEPNIQYSKQQMQPPSIVEKTAILKDTPEGLTEILPEEPAQVHHFKMEGTLYLDHSGKIPFGVKDLALNDPSEEDLRNFKRVGSAKLVEEEGKFVFYSGNASYTYQAHELDQVVFYDQGVVFLLKDSNSPRPVYFTTAMDELKDFLSQ